MTDYEFTNSAISKMLVTIRKRLIEAREKGHHISFKEWWCKRCAAKAADESGAALLNELWGDKPVVEAISNRLLLTISDSSHPVAIAAHTHCMKCGEFFDPSPAAAAIDGR